jgi:hypothetical protein
MSHNDLPCGPLCFDDLKWEEKHHYGNHILVSTLPEERLDDFVEGQGHLCGRPGAEAACECIYFMRGNICKHIVKVSILHGQTVYKVPFDVSSTARIQPPIRVLPGELTN